MADEWQLSFFLEWYDPQSDELKPYILHYHADETIELIERNTKKIFLKRIRVPTIKRDDLFVGNSITVYSRQLSIIEPANEFTRSALEKRVTKALFLITPVGYQRIGHIITMIEQSGLSLLNLRMVQLRLEHLPAVRTFLRRGGMNNIDSSDLDQQQQQQLLNDVSVLVEVVLSASSAAFEVGIASLGKAGLLGDAVLVGKVGIDVFVSTKTGRSGLDVSLPSTAVLDNCTACILRPRMVREGRVGEILSTILASGFEVSAIKFMLLETTHVDEFLQVYRGIYRRYHDVVKYMSSSPCVVLEIRGDDVVRRFRELCGPFDVQIAQKLRPQSLRAKYGKPGLCNAVHCTDMPEDGELESQFLFATR